MSDQSISAYPLHWPGVWERNQEPRRSRFSPYLTIAEARDEVYRELDLMGATDIVISSNAELLKSGEIASRQRYMQDTGVAVYFSLAGQKVIPCDEWERIQDNLHAIALTVGALRGLERWGTKKIVSAAFEGFAALPPIAGGIDPLAYFGLAQIHRTKITPDMLNAAFRERAKTAHPDAGGSDEAFRELQQMFEAARVRLGWMA